MTVRIARDYSFNEKEAGLKYVNASEVMKELHVRNDPNCDYASNMFKHRVLFKSVGTGSYGSNEYGIAHVCCLTGLLCDVSTGGAYMSTHNEYDCNMCKIPDRMPKEAERLMKKVIRKE